MVGRFTREERIILYLVEKRGWKFVDYPDVEFTPPEQVREGAKDRTQEMVGELLEWAHQRYGVYQRCYPWETPPDDSSSYWEEYLFPHEDILKEFGIVSPYE